MYKNIFKRVDERYLLSKEQNSCLFKNISCAIFIYLLFFENYFGVIYFYFTTLRNNFFV